jgi:ATP-dependent Lhr-like helicase
MYTDDGFAIRLPDTEHPPSDAELFIEPEEVREMVTGQLGQSALFASHFRENAARALLLPRRRPNQRTPLWQQRQRSHSLLQVASRHPDFPIILETYRECLVDVFDLDALTELMARVRSREVRVVSVTTERSSPFAASLLFDYVAEFLYEGDAPLGERRAQALALDRDLLAELLGAEELRELLSPEVIAAIELELQRLTGDRGPRDVDETEDLMRWLGDLRTDEAAARGAKPSWLDELARDHRAVTVRVGGEERWIAAEDAARYRDALGVSLPVGIPEIFLGPSADAIEALLMRWARTHVPFVAAEPARRWGLPEQLVDSALAALTARGRLLSGEFHPGRGCGSRPVGSIAWWRWCTSCRAARCRFRCSSATSCRRGSPATPRR